MLTPVTTLGHNHQRHLCRVNHTCGFPNSVHWTNVYIIRNRQDAVEAVAIAASGKVKVKYTMRGLSEINE
jgi:D-arabinose 1-dehydrogenase-like Zn-dependent alcohol dehydrogenase